MNFLSGFDKCKKSFFVASVWVLHPIVISIWKQKFRLVLKRKGNIDNQIILSLSL